jgi:hypothetical protein
MQAPPRQLSVRREYLGLLRLILQGGSKGAWMVYRDSAAAALELVPMYLVHGWAPTLCLRLLDRASGILLDSMHSAAAHVCRRFKRFSAGRGGAGARCGS